jgi:hypothetical protein
VRLQVAEAEKWLAARKAGGKHPSYGGQLTCRTCRDKEMVARGRAQAYELAAVAVGQVQLGVTKTEEAPSQEPVFLIETDGRGPTEPAPAGSIWIER